MGSALFDFEGRLRCSRYGAHARYTIRRVLANGDYHNFGLFVDQVHIANLFHSKNWVRLGDAVLVNPEILQSHRPSCGHRILNKQWKVR